MRDKTAAMVAYNHRKSQEMTERVCKTIDRLMEAKEIVTVKRLVKETGASRSFFYKKAAVVEKLREVRERQMGANFTAAPKIVLDTAMERVLEMQKDKLEKMRQERDELKAERDKLKKALDKKDLKRFL